MHVSYVPSSNPAGAVVNLFASFSHSPSSNRTSQPIKLCLTAYLLNWIYLPFKSCLPTFYIVPTYLLNCTHLPFEFYRTTYTLRLYLTSYLLNCTYLKFKLYLPTNLCNKWRKLGWNLFSMMDIFFSTTALNHFCAWRVLHSGKGVFLLLISSIFLPTGLD